MKRYYYHTPDGELHGPSDFDFLVREVRYAGLPLGLMVREERSEDWIWIGDIPGTPPEWKLLKERGMDESGQNMEMRQKKSF